MRSPQIVFAVVCAIAVPALVSGCRPAAQAAPDDPAPAGPPWMADVTAKVGLAFRHDAGPLPGRYFMPQIIGSGAALLDFDGDGRLDLYLLHNGGPAGAKNQLFRQTPDGRFVDVSQGSGLDFAGYGMGVAVGDVNNDGRPDVLVTLYTGLRLFLNNGSGTFTDVTAQSGLANPLWGTAAAFFDFDRDGWLDLVVVNYVDYDPVPVCGGPPGDPDYCHPIGFPGTVTRLFRNRGPSPAGTARFDDVTVAAGLGKLTGPALGVLCADFDGDGWPDVFVANDAKANRLWVNQKDGTFLEEAVIRGVAYSGRGGAQGNMGVAWGDVDGDGLPDLFVTHLGEELHTLWWQSPRGLYADATAAAGLTAARWRGTGFGTVLADFDHDGMPDLAIVNGRVARGALASRADPKAFWAPYAERGQLFRNDGKGVLRDVSGDNPAFAAAAVGRGLAVGDLDNDGALDLVMTSIAGPAVVYRNVAPDRGHWLMARATDPALGGRDAYDAVVTVRAGDRRWSRLVNPGFSYLCSNDPRVHFGLGRADRVDAVEVRWPDGREEVFPGGPADRLVELRKGGGRPAGGRK